MFFCFCIWASSCPRTIYWKDYPFSIDLLLHLCWKSIIQIFTDLFLLLYLISFKFSSISHPTLFFLFSLFNCFFFFILFCFFSFRSKAFFFKFLYMMNDIDFPSVKLSLHSSDKPYFVIIFYPFLILFYSLC